MFPTLIETKHKIENSTYFDKMSKDDLKARHALTIAEYKGIYLDSIKNFSDNEKIILMDFTREIDKICRRFKRFVNIPWKFAKLCCHVEEGFPHTIDDIIFLPFDFLYTRDKEFMKKTLIHEKIHLFQRVYPLQTNILIQNYWNFAIFSLATKIKKNSRNNPDLNNLLYHRYNSTCFQEYSDNPTSLTHSALAKSCREKYEHPYEQMAYIIPTIVCDNKILNDDYVMALKWMQKYF